MSKENTRIDAKALAAGFTRFQSSGAGVVLPKDSVVEEYKVVPFSKTLPSYDKIKNTFKPDLTIKDQRFILSDLVSDQLSVEEEQKARFNKKVEVEVEAHVAGIKELAHKEGFDAGFEAGRKQAFDEEKIRLAAFIENATAAIQALASAKEKLSETYSQIMVDVVFRLARVILHKEVSEKPELIKHTIAGVLERMGREDDVRIRMSSASFSVIEEVKKHVEGLGRQGRVIFDVDANMSDGDCVVDSMGGEVASFIDDRIEKLKEEVTERLKTKFAKTGSDGI